MSRKALSHILLAGVIIPVILAAATLIPHSSATISDLGYYTFCPFAPWSTLALLFLAGLCWVLRQYITSQRA
jgi:hypothetical protein